MKTRNSVILVLFLLLSVLITVFVFGNSMKNSAASNADSDSFIALFEPLLERLTWISDSDYSKVIRKTAHFVEFFALGFFYGGVMCLLIPKKGNLRFPAVLFVVLLAAVTDEYIQSFTDRTSSVKDVLLDFSGALVGAVAVFWLFWQIRRVREKKCTK